MEAVYRDYAPKGVKFFYVYKPLAHPGFKDYREPYNLYEKVQHANHATKTLGITIPWLIDSMENMLHHKLGAYPNPHIIVDPEGNIVSGRAWCDASVIRRDLEKYVGKVEHPTYDVKLNIPPEPKRVTGVIPPIVREHKMPPLWVTPCRGNNDFYFVKLVAECKTGAFNADQQVYFKFYLDPIYDTHWNNLATPLTATIEWPTHFKSKTTKLVAPVLKVPSDNDPREFLIDATGYQQGGVIKVRVTFAMCDDKTGECKAMVQNFRIRSYFDRTPYDEKDDCPPIWAE